MARFLSSKRSGQGRKKEGGGKYAAKGSWGNRDERPKLTCTEKGDQAAKLEEKSSRAYAWHIKKNTYSPIRRGKKRGKRGGENRGNESNDERKIGVYQGQLL